MDTQPYQRCGSCKQGVPLDGYSPSYRGKPGTWCKACFADYNSGRQRTCPPHENRVCSYCGTTYSPRQLKTQAAFCSRECKDKAHKAALMAARHAAKRLLPDRSCLWCAATMPKTMRSDAFYCSAQCNSAAHAVTRKIAKRAGTTKSDVLLSRAYIAERDGWRCGICGGRVSPDRSHPDPLAPSIDHVVPLARGGTNDLSNLQLAHLRCNLRKRAVEGWTAPV